MRPKLRITNRTIVLTAIIGSLLVLTMMSANTIWASRKTGASTRKAVSAVSSFYLDAMADHRAKTITNLINNTFEEMEQAVVFIADENVGSTEELRTIIGRVKSLLGLKRFALVDEDDVVYTQYTTYTGASRHPFLSDEKLHDHTINTVSPYGSSKQLCLAIPTSNLSIMGKPFKACFVQLDIADIVNLLAFDDQGRTYFALYAQNGENLSDTELGPVIARNNLFDALEGSIPDNMRKETYERFGREKAGSLTFDSGEVEETLCYVPIEGTGWEMAVLIRDSVIQDQIRDVSESNARTSRRQILFTLVSVGALVAILIFEIRMLSLAKLEEEKKQSKAFHDMANTDSLTGIRNKHAYSENEAILDARIQAGEIEKLAIIVGDLNGLKHVNDTQGHAAGDQLIRDACALICEQFSHGAVFRIGGDEFAIILQGLGFDTMDDTIASFNRTVEDNIAKHEVVVSIGYAVWKPGDERLSDVFERADKMMYERKKELKRMGAPTSRL